MDMMLEKSQVVVFKCAGGLRDSIHIGEDYYIYDIWINPKTGDDVLRCPWLRKLPNQDKYICRIHDVKPEHCRKYPRSRQHAEEIGCKEQDKTSY